MQDLVSQFVYASKPNVPDYMIQGGVTYRPISDHLGSVRLVLDAMTSGLTASQRVGAPPGTWVHSLRDDAGHAEDTGSTSP